jgi:hypothetical protein
MAWETRARGTRYYTRSRKVRGQVVREYVGGGLLGEAAATLDEEARRERQQRRDALVAEQSRLAALDAPAAQVHTIANLLAAGALLLAGYRQHDRGEWRKPREHTHA